MGPVMRTAVRIGTSRMNLGKLSSLNQPTARSERLRLRSRRPLAVKRYTGHVLSCLGWGTHTLAPLSFRAATYSGAFTLLPLLTGCGRAHHGKILRDAAALADRNQLKPLLAEQHFGKHEIANAYETVVRSGISGGLQISRVECHRRALAHNSARLLSRGLWVRFPPRPP